VFCLIAKNNPQHDFYFLFDRPYNSSVICSPNIYPIIVKPQANHPLLWRLWYNWQIPAVMKKIKADVFVSPDGFCSLRTKIPQCLVVHDLSFLHHTDSISKSHLAYYKKHTPFFLKKAKRIATVSEFSKQDICKQYGTAPEKISVVYSAANPMFVPLAEEEKEIIKQKYTSGTEYFLFTGAVHPQNNLINLLKAYSVFKKKQKSSMKLVIAGHMARENNAFVKLLQTYKFRNDVILTGYISKEEFTKLVASAYAMVYPSFVEGFGVPPLEALQCHVPAAVSNLGSLQEIGGNACLYFDPNNIEEMAEKMTRLYKDEDMRKELTGFGQKKLIQFTCNRTAALLWDCILATASTDSLTFAK
jgi:glycosyltransferase involved in cell wall biosynthesis